MNQILQGQPMTVFGDGSQTRAFSYIDDIVPIMVDAVNTPTAYNEVFNVGADRSCSVNELAYSVAAAMDSEPNILHVPARNEVQDAYASHDKVRRVFGERRTHSLAEGLEYMAQWVRAHGARTSQEFEAIEVSKNFPKAWLQSSKTQQPIIG